MKDCDPHRARGRLPGRPESSQRHGAGENPPGARGPDGFAQRTPSIDLGVSSDDECKTIGEASTGSPLKESSRTRQGFRRDDRPTARNRQPPDDQVAGFRFRTDHATSLAKSGDHSGSPDRRRIVKYRFSNIYEELNLHPRRHVRVTFAKQTEDVQQDCERRGVNRWPCFVRPEAGCGQDWFTWIEEYVTLELNRSSDIKPR